MRGVEALNTRDFSSKVKRSARKAYSFTHWKEPIQRRERRHQTEAMVKEKEEINLDETAQAGS